MIKLEFETKMSGVRVDLPEELYKEMSGHLDMFGYVTPKDVPEFVLYGIWWDMHGISVEVFFIEDSDNIIIRHRYGEKQEITTDYYSKSLYNSLVGRLDHDDQIKVWLYKNKPEIWQQLIDLYKTPKNIFNSYIRFNH